MDAKLRITLWAAIYGVVTLFAGLVIEWTPLRNAGVILLINAPLFWIIALWREKKTS
jgi:ABC-type Mn2+/Zn2+ transport system permease subunit